MNEWLPCRDTSGIYDILHAIQRGCIMLTSGRLVGLESISFLETDRLTIANSFA